MKKLFLLLLLFTNICLGQVLAWQLNGASGNESNINSTLTNTNINISSLSRSSVNTSTLFNAFSSTNYPVSGTKSDALTNKRGFTFTVSTKSCYLLSLSTIDSKFRRSGTGPNSFAWYYSIDGVNFIQIGSDISFTATTTGGVIQPQINLSTITDLQNVNSGTNITFLLIGWGATATSGTFAIGRSTTTSSTDYSLSIGGSFLTSTWSTIGWSTTPTSNSIVIIDEDYNTSNNGNIDACSVKINDIKTLTINTNPITNPNPYLKIQNELVIIGTGNVIVEDGGSIVQVNDNAINTGNITYKRKTTPVTRFDYTYWSTPVSPQTLLNLSPNTLSDKFYRWDFSIPNWVNVLSSSDMSVGTGYIIRAPQTFDIVTPSIYNAVFYGKANNGVYNIPIGSEYTLIGNPYPSAISADMLITNDPNLSGTLYFWTHNTPITNYNYTGDDYATYTLVGGVGTAAINTGINNNTPNGKIAAGQGFFFKNTSTSTNIIFNNSFRLTNNNNQFFRTSQEKDRFWLEMTNDNGLYKQILIGYVNGATNNIDGNYDGEILEAGNIISLYTIVDDKLLTIQGRQYPFNIDDSINLGYKTNISGDFKIKLSDVNGLFTTQNIYLKDLYSNTIHDLTQSPYIFNSFSGTFNDRFILRYTNNSLGNNDFVINNTIIYNKDNKINIDSNKIIKNVKVYDITGKILYDNNFNSNNVFFNLECSKQILFVKIKTEDDQVITRKILND